LALSRLASCFAQYCLCLRVMPELRKEKRLKIDEAKPLFIFGGWMTMSNIISPLLVNLDRFVIGSVISVTAVAYYATPHEIVTKLGIVPSSLVATLFPAFAYANNSDTNHTIQLFSKSIEATFILVFPIVLLFVTFSHEGLMLWLGQDFANNSTPVLQWLSAGIFINSLAQVLFSLIQGRGRPDLTAKFHLIELVFYLPFLWCALKQYGIAGAAAAWTFRVTFDGFLLLWATQRLMPATKKLSLRISGCIIIALILILLCSLPESLVFRTILFTLFSMMNAVFILLFLRRNGILGILIQRWHKS